MDEDDAVALAEKVSKQVERVDELVDSFRQCPRCVFVIRELGRWLLAAKRRRFLAGVDQRLLCIRDPVAVGVTDA